MGESHPRGMMYGRQHSVLVHAIVSFTIVLHRALLEAVLRQECGSKWCTWERS